jgi:hypothetical protein
MKKLALILFASAVLATVAFAAWTKQSARVMRVQVADITFASNTSTTATSVKMDAFLEALTTDDSDTTKAKGRGDWAKVSFDLIAEPVASTTYTAASKTVNGTQLAALIRQVALDEATRQGIAP